MTEGLLEPHEQQQLVMLLGALYGSTAQFLPYKHLFNQATLEATEALLVDLDRCNAQMKKLIVGVAGGAAFVTKGWLRGVLQKMTEALQGEHLVFNGAACRNVARAKGVSRVIATTL